MGPGRCGFGRCGNGFGPYGGGWVGWLDSVALWVLAVIAIVVLVRMLTRGSRRRARWAAGGYRPGPRWGGPVGGPAYAVAQPPMQAQAQYSQAEALLAERFARGEIGPEEYQQNLGVLRGYGYPGAQAPGAAAPAEPYPAAQPEDPENPTTPMSPGGPTV